MGTMWKVVWGSVAATALGVGALLSYLPDGGTAFAQSNSSVRSKYQEEKEKANASTVSIISSSVSSTYTRFAQDIQNVLDDKTENGLRVLPILGSGGGQNIHDMLFLKGIDMGITDAAYLQYYKRQDPVLYGNIEERINYICKLLNAEFHLLAGKDIRSYADLQGKKVSFWKRLSITSLAAQTIFDALGIQVEPVYLDNSAAIEKMRRGEIAAVARMSGAPHSDYNGVTREDNFHLLGLDVASLPDSQYGDIIATYLPAQLTSEHYPQLIPEGEQVPTVATTIVLAVYNWPPQTERYAKLQNFVQRFFDEIDKFQHPARHPKWSNVNIAANVSGWQRFTPAQDWLDQNLQASRSNGQARDLRTAFEAFMKEYTVNTGLAPRNEADREVMFQEFSKWWRAQSFDRR